jgi:hypothetical protein
LKSFNRALAAKTRPASRYVTTLIITAMKQETENESKDWVKVLYEVILKILTLGFYHIEKHKNR